MRLDRQMGRGMAALGFQRARPDRKPQVYLCRAADCGYDWPFGNSRAKGDRRMSRVCLGLLTLALAAPLVHGQPAQRSTNDRQIIDLLARVHDQGAALFNAGDHGGCYRMFQGSLVTAKLVLPKELQESVDRGLSRAEMQTSPAQRALALHDVIEDVRKKLHPTAGKPEPLPPPKKEGMADAGVPVKSPVVPGVPEPPPRRMDPPKVATDRPKVSTDGPKELDAPSLGGPTKSDTIEAPKLPGFGSPEPPIAPAKPGKLNIGDPPPPVISGVPTSNPKPTKPMPEPVPLEPLPVAPRPLDPAPPVKVDDTPPPLKLQPLPGTPMSDPLDLVPPPSKAPASPAPPSGVPDLSAPPLKLDDLPPPKPKDKEKGKEKSDTPPPLPAPGK